MYCSAPGKSALVQLRNENAGLAAHGRPPRPMPLAPCATSFLRSAFKALMAQSMFSMYMATRSARRITSCRVGLRASPSSASWVTVAGVHDSTSFSRKLAAVMVRTQVRKVRKCAKCAPRAHQTSCHESVCPTRALGQEQDDS